VVNDFETYSQFVKINKIAGYLFCRSFALLGCFAAVLDGSIWLKRQQTHKDNRTSWSRYA
jgi:hypothetical protein